VRASYYSDRHFLSSIFVLFFAVFFLVFVDRSDYSDIWRDIRGVHYV